MSIAGIRSNRGDIYQTLIAFDWAITVLLDPEFEWIEIDSVNYPVDDVVIGKTDGSQICCQCKKNQPDFRSWSIADLEDELKKASQALTRNQLDQVHFYSRGEFGELAKLREYRILHANEPDFKANLTEELTKTNSKLAASIAVSAPELSTFEFLQRTSFVISPDYERIEMLLRERLRRFASNSKSAFDALWVRLDKLGGRVEGGNMVASTQYRLSKNDIKDILHHAGAMLVPELSIEQVRTSFARTSAIGRSWHREIAGQHILSPVVDEIMAAIDDKKQTVLLTGLPGSGKTCAMLSLQELLEQRMQIKGDLVPLFIQSREFADFATVKERYAQGLPEQWVEQAARLAEKVYVIVIIDSLDVLSIAREHSVLSYFLSQIDQLLLIPNVTVITACREFDRKYDRRIAARKWDYELKCPPLDWENEIVPLLDKIRIESSNIDAATRDLIRNPRELNLFVELAKREGSFNVVTSQALAQRYLDSIVLADTELGEEALLAIESAAEIMLKNRSLSIPKQRFNVSENILRRLQSLNVLQQNQDGKLMFGHQTLLDVLVISRAIRQGVTLNEFIQELPPVPFVRPSVRSFVAQLATEDRREFRKQLRTVLTGNSAFHLRRLVAESFAQQIPQTDDWPFIRDLREGNPEIFQVIYTQSGTVEWHRFWLNYLIPMLVNKREVEGLTAHVNWVAQWKDEDAPGVLAFWTEVLSLDWIDGERISRQLVFSLSEFAVEDLSVAAPIIDRLLRISKRENSFLGRAVSRCVKAGVVDDEQLWRYITGEITDEDVISYHFDKKLFCQPYEFGDKNDDFLNQRMKQSTALLNLALETIEFWSHIKFSHNGNISKDYRSGFLHKTSFDDAHKQTDYRHLDSLRILFDAIEESILEHARNHSDWWQANREQLSLNSEGSLFYFAILAFTESPQQNIDLIVRVLCDKERLESELNYELGELIREAFVYLDRRIQDQVLVILKTLWDDCEADEKNHIWILFDRAEYISAIPCYLRSPDTQVILDLYEKTNGEMIRQPKIRIRGGIVSPPFPYEKFLDVSDDGVIRLLAHYCGYTRDSYDFLVGGESEVGWQLREASSRHPSRFLCLLTSEWSNISGRFKDEIMQGVSSFLSHRYGNLQVNGERECIEEPDALDLVNQILDELERHPSHWRLNSTAAKTIEACANVIVDTQAAERLVFLAVGFGCIDEESTIHGDSVDLINSGINMKGGNVAEGLMILANKFQEKEILYPELLWPALRLFAKNEHPAVRALILRRLPYLQSKNPEFGWKLFNLAMQSSVGLWQSAEPCLYYAYHNHFEKVSPLLECIYREGNKEDLETWGRISALATLVGHIDFENFIRELKEVGNTEAWKGAASVWTHTGNIRQYRGQCLAGIEAGLSEKSHAYEVASLVDNIFRENTNPISIPIELLQLCFSVFEKKSENKYHRLFRFDEWLNTLSQIEPENALAATEIYLGYVTRVNPYFNDQENQLVQLVTRLFAEAEEREESDSGAMLKRVVVVQDMLLSLGINSMNEWLKAAERQ